MQAPSIPESKMLSISLCVLRVGFYDTVILMHGNFWTLPKGNADFSKRRTKIKRYASLRVGTKNVPTLHGLHHFNLCEDFNRVVEPLRLFHPTNKNPRGKPSRLTLDFLVSLESGVFNRNSACLFFSPQGAGNKTQRN